VSAAVEMYREHQAQNGNKTKSYMETRRRLLRFFQPRLKTPVCTLSPEWCAGRYAALAKEMSVDSHRNILAECKTWLRWCVGKGWLRESPLETVEGTGKRRHGKPQLSRDESRRLLAVAYDESEVEDGAVAAAMALLMGMRASEIADRQVRDLDDGGRILRIPDSKTEAGKRDLEIPGELQVMLRARATGRPGTALLLDCPRADRRDGWVRYHVRRLCKAAGVPVISSHGLRGTHSSIAVEAGATGRLVADQLGHGSPTVSETSYTRRDVQDAAKNRAAWRVLDGGRGEVRKEERSEAATPDRSATLGDAVDKVG